MKTKLMVGLAGAVSLAMAQNAMAACNDVSRSDLKAAVTAAAAAITGGYGLPMWATMVDETGKVCHVVTSGTAGAAAGNNEWLGSRIISAQKANTANAFSLGNGAFHYAISTANLYSAVQPGGSLFGLQESNPVNAAFAYLGSPVTYGTNADFLKNQRIGGVNVFGGGLAIYDAAGTTKIGAIGVSGDTSCRDHAFAWQVRANLYGAGVDAHPAGTGITTFNMDAAGAVQAPLAGAAMGDEMIINVAGADYWDAWSQPACPNSTGLGAAANTANGTILN
jgi:uncharacterized protein GlcG (DUF336 family)